MKRVRISTIAPMLAMVFNCSLFGQTDKSAAAKSLLDFKYQFKIGVLPFVDNTGSGGRDLGSALSRAVQAEIAHSTKLEGRVLKLDEGTNAEDVDSEKAVELGRSHTVDAVLVGTVLEASSEQSDKSSSGPSIGGISLGGSSHSVRAIVTLQGDFYNTTTGKQIDSIRVTGKSSQTKVGANVSTSLGNLSSGGASFEKSPIGKALHDAVTDLVKKLSDDQSQLMRYNSSTTPDTPPSDTTTPAKPDNPQAEVQDSPAQPASAASAESAGANHSSTASPAGDCASLTPSAFG